MKILDQLAQGNAKPDRGIENGEITQPVEFLFELLNPAVEINDDRKLLAHGVVATAQCLLSVLLV